MLQTLYNPWTQLAVSCLSASLNSVTQPRTFLRICSARTLLVRSCNPSYAPFCTLLHLLSLLACVFHFSPLSLSLHIDVRHLIKKSMLLLMLLIHQMTTVISSLRIFRRCMLISFTFLISLICRF